MLRSYLRSAVRSLRRHFGYTLINLAGLAVGIAAFLLIFLYARYEYSFDDYHVKADRLYRIIAYGGLGEPQWNGYVSGDPVTEMRASFPDVEDATKFMPCGPDRVQYEGEVFRDLTVQCAESNLFNLFSFDLLEGDPESVLDRPNTAVITRSLAEKIFGKANVVGEILPIYFDRDDERFFEITGVMEDVPANTHFIFDLLLSYESLLTTNRCLTCGQVMYSLLRSDADPEAVANRILRHVREVDGKEYVENIRLEPVRDIHFSQVQAERQSDVKYLYLLSTIGIVLLLIACANYSNLATARSLQRTREVGVRKVLGAHKSHLLGQLLSETILLCLVALPFALVLLIIAMPLFNELAGTEVSLSWGVGGSLIGAAVGVVVLSALLGGIYPAMLLARANAVETLRGRLTVSFSGVLLRRSLVVFQFTASIALIVITLVVMRQVGYMQQKNLGFNAEHVAIVKITDPALIERYRVLQDEFERMPEVIGTTAAFGLPGERGFNGMHFIDKPQGEDGPTVNFTRPVIDTSFLRIMEVPLLAGRNVSARVDVRNVEALVNRSALAAMAWSSPEEALGKEIGRDLVVGVVEDFHFESMHKQIAPLLMTQNEWGVANSVGVRLRSGSLPAAIQRLEAAWKRTGTTMPFEFTFLRDELNRLYERELRTARVFASFGFLAIAIACLGVFGLAAFSVARRTKEIGIRKVLGATAPRIVKLFVRDFVWLVLIAFAVATPIALMGSRRWLESFAYRIEVSWTLFAVAGAAALIIAVVSAGTQAFRAAMGSPAEALRYE